MLCRISLLLCLQIICTKCAVILIFYRPHIIEGLRTTTEKNDLEIQPRVLTDDVDKKSLQGERRLLFPIEDYSKPDPHAFLPTVRTTTMPPFPYYTVRPVKNSVSNEKFSAKLYQILSTESHTSNLIYSPLSLQSLLANLYLGAEHETANQLRTGLELPESPSELLSQFQSIMAETQQTSSKNFELNFAQKIYFKNNIVLRYNVRDTAKAYFYSEIAPISFDSPTAAANEINNWVASKTHNRITGIVKPDSFDADTEAMLVNAIYLKAKWAREFSTQDTLKQEFFVGNEVPSIFVDTMYIEDDFKYGEFPEMDAKIVELPFLDSELSMLIILPNKNDGLAAVESHLENVNLNQLLGKMKTAAMTVRLPKFKIESDLNMVEPLKKLGIQDIFTDNAQLGKLFSNPNVKVSKVQHKAFINVNEGGLEAAAATFVQIVPLSLEPNMVYFTANHPFIFAIRSPQAVYFIGHVINNFQ